MTISSIEKEFDELFTNPATTDMRKMNLNGEPYPLASCKDIKSFYRRKIEEIIDEIIKLSDNIEAKYDTPEMEEWKAFKRFRNTLRDNFKK